MALEVKKVEYFNITVDGYAGGGFKLLSVFADVGVSLLAFRAIPVENNRTRFSIFPNDSSKMKDGAIKAGLNPDGPHSALIIKSDSDDPGECAGIFEKLSHADVLLNESYGIADIKDSYGVVLCMRQEDCEKALAALKM